MEKMTQAQIPLESVSSIGISRAIGTIERERSILPVKYATTIIDCLAQPGKEPLIPKITLIDESDIEESSEEPNPKPPLKISGGAVFKGDRLVGWMDERETRGWTFLTNMTRRAVMSVKLPKSPEDPEDAEEEYLTVVISQVETELKAKKDGNGSEFALKIFADGRIEDKTAPGDFLRDRDKVASMNRRTAAAIQNDITKALKKAQSLNADVFGLGWLLYRTQYKQWQQVEDRWDEIFPNVAVDMDVRVDIRRSGLVNRVGAVK